MSSREFSEWVSYYERERLPWDRIEMMLGTLTAIYAQVNSGKQSKAYTASDFIPQFGPRTYKSADELEAIFMQHVPRFTTKEG